MAMKELEVPERGRVLIDIPAQGRRVLVSIDAAAMRIVDDRCHHRGGPVHLAYVDDLNVRRCPWHDRRLRSDEPCQDICSVYYPSRRLLRMIGDFVSGTLWPARAIAGQSPPCGAAGLKTTSRRYTEIRS